MRVDERSFKLYSGQDPRVISAYTIQEVSQFLSIPMATLRSWVLGRYYPTEEGQKHFKPILSLPDPKRKSHLSFINLVEAHVLDAIRREHKVPLYKVRSALEYLQRKFPSKHPLADQKFETDGIDLFIQKYGQLINISQDGQLAIKSIMQAYLQRIERDSSGLVIRLYPFVRRRDINEPKMVVIDPFVSFGKPILVGTGIPTAIIAQRYKSGESIDELAEDYGRSRLEIEEAIRCELPQAA
ncbi:MAG: hypothetical protein DMG05_12100 [Acidobacteria bacterium]|nr:MAG: hypothetical protein DMG05_12100 [Acidobacteriota bacterium]